MAEFKEDARYVRNPRDIDVPEGSARETVLTWIHRYGGITTTPLVEEFYFRHLYKPKDKPNRASSDQSAKVVLNDLFDGGWLSRPDEQKYIRFRRRYPLVHRITLEAEQLLKDRSRFSANAPKPWGSYEHNMLTACIYQGYALSAEAHGIGFVPQHVFLENRVGHFMVAGEDGKTRKLTPDAIFMLAQDGKDCLVFLELDRGTEASNPNDPRRKSLGRSADEYFEVIGKGAPGEKFYKKHFGLPVSCGAQVHFVTTVPRFERAMHTQILRVQPKGSSYFLTHICTEATTRSLPVGYIDMLAVAWNRAGLPPFRWAEVDNALDK